MHSLKYTLSAVTALVGLSASQAQAISMSCRANLWPGQIRCEQTVNLPTSRMDALGTATKFTSTTHRITIRRTFGQIATAIAQNRDGNVITSISSTDNVERSLDFTASSSPSARPSRLVVAISNSGTLSSPRANLNTTMWGAFQNIFISNGTGTLQVDADSVSRSDSPTSHTFDCGSLAGTFATCWAKDANGGILTDPNSFGQALIRVNQNPRFPQNPLSMAFTTPAGVVPRGLFIDSGPCSTPANCPGRR